MCSVQSPHAAWEERGKRGTFAPGPPFWRGLEEGADPLERKMIVTILTVT